MRPEEFFCQAVLPGSSVIPPDGVDWHWIAEQAVTHGVWPLLLENAQVNGWHVPPAYLQHFCFLWGKWLVRRSEMLSELANVTRRLAAAGIKPVVLKGPVLDWCVYDRSGRRRYSDVDVLVAEGSLVETLDVLRSLGFTVPGVVRRDGHTIDGCAKELRSGRLSLDLHRCLDYTWRTGERPNEVIERAIPFEGLPDAFRLADDDLVLHQCVHLYKDETEYRESIRKGQHRKLMRRLDVALLARRGFANWEVVRHRAEQYGFMRHLQFAVSAVHESVPCSRRHSPRDRIEPPLLSIQQQTCVMGRVVADDSVWTS